MTRKKIIIAVIMLIALACGTIGGVIFGIDMTIKSAVLIESSDYHYGISYLNNEVEMYYTW